MTTLYTCAKGHQWKVRVTQPDVAAQAPVACPTCGAPGQPAPEATVPEDRLAAQEMALQPTYMDQGGAAPVTESNEWAAPSAAVPDPLPETFGRYRIARKLGRGGMGAVYLAQDTQLGRPVALKVPHFTNSDGPRVLERFYREARAAATINHPNICPVYDVGQINGIHYLTMAYLEGKPLADYVKEGKPLPARSAAAIVRRLALGLQEAHRHGVIHRDLKPANVMISHRQVPIIMDFGLARSVNQEPGQERLTQEGTVLGTPAYMAPEQVAGNPEQMGLACDIYSLGVILYELLTGRTPFQGPVGAVLGQIMAAAPPPPSQLRPDLDPRLEQICLKAMAKKPEDRYASMTEFAAALKGMEQSGEVRLDTLKPGESGPTVRYSVADDVPALPARRRGKGLLVVVLLLVAGGAAAAGYWWKDSLFPAAGRATTESPQPPAGPEAVRLPTHADLTVIVGEKTVVELKVERNGYHGPIDVQIAGLPARIRAEPTKLEPGRDAAGIELDVGPSAAIATWNVRAVATAGDRQLEAPFKITAVKSRPMQALMHGLAGRETLDARSFPPAWRKDGVFAQLKGQGEIKFPLVPASWYVCDLEMDVTAKNSQLHVHLGESENSLGLGFSADKGKELLYQLEGLRRNETASQAAPLGQRLHFKLFVANHRLALQKDGVPVLTSSAVPADLNLKIVAATAETEGTIYRCSFRELTEKDAQGLQWPFPRHVLPLQPEATEKRLAKFKAGLEQRPVAGKNFLGPTTGMPLVWINPGEFEFGARLGPQGRLVRGKPATITKGFWIGQFEVTQGEWKHLFGSNPSRIQGSPYLPVDWVSWEDAGRFCDELTKREKSRLPAGYVYRLPTEAEWEYACQAGSPADNGIKPEDTWNVQTSGDRPHEVGEKPANKWNLCDMQGNVAEWCLDASHPIRQDAQLGNDPFKPGNPAQDSFVVRGGSWWAPPENSRSHMRGRAPNIASGYRGFRIVLGPALGK